jgi:hypothetical protein
MLRVPIRVLEHISIMDRAQRYQTGPHVARWTVFTVVPQMLAVAVWKRHRKLRARRAIVASAGITFWVWWAFECQQNHQY